MLNKTAQQKNTPTLHNKDVIKLENVIKNAKKHKYRYIDPDAVKKIMGKWSPISIISFSYLLDCFLTAMNDTGISIMDANGAYQSDIYNVPTALKGIADKLLNSNRCYQQGKWNLFNDLDFDVVHQCIPGRAVTTQVKPYFAFDEYKRTKDESRIVIHAIVDEFEGTPWAISFPLQYIMKDFPKVENQHSGYCHKIAFLDNNGIVENEYVYIGVTSRDWLKRMNEHFREIKSGSNKLFHKTWREFTGNKNILLSSELIVNDHSYEQIMAWEETMVDRLMKDNRSLNMIPGGFKGMQYLYKHSLLKQDKVSLSERDAAIEEYQKLHPKAGIANLFISNLWKDKEYAAKVICSSDERLSVEQVIKIRELSALNYTDVEILKIVDARNLLQVQRVMKGITYSRII
ncbi:hypothetical protein [Aeromonas veronii]|uniref:hypothetical protein n=1 Tax=Aeromonas veronii TaxID=654 RepID=UPI001FFEFFB4|nr:hypothetical protein [Aeromonas veronii]UPK54453.1 hypothetical protein MYF86_18525 [Aeromonas veronii]